MTVKSLMACTLVACATLIPVVTQAADLDYGGAPTDRYSAYDDPRYADIYGTRPTRETYPDPDALDRAPPPRRFVPQERPVPPRYSYAPAPHVAPACAPRREIRDRLAAEGWFDFRPVAVRPNVAVVHARRGRGALFLLNVDRCTGAVVHARPLDRGIGGPYAFAPRRWDRAYYRF